MPRAKKSSFIQAVVFSKKTGITEARKWLKKHNMKPIKKPDKTTNTIRFRLRDPKRFKRFATKTIAKQPSIQLVIGFQ